MSVGEWPGAHLNVVYSRPVRSDQPSLASEQAQRLGGALGRRATSMPTLVRGNVDGVKSSRSCVGGPELVALVRW